jgi:3-hydroxyisobutyrate dehydrogenase-like beta-hydroxyacid dehydrogenase
MEGGSDMELGFIGLGAMGGRMSRRLLAAGHRVVGHDIDPAMAAAFKSAGGEVRPDARGVADRAEVVFASLPSQAASLECAFGPRGIAGGTAVKTYVETSTVGLATVAAIAEKLAAAGVAFVDAPVSGGTKGAEAGTLSTMVAGAPDAVAAVRGLLDHFSANVFVVGERPGFGQVCKIINNAVSITAMLVSCEAITMGVKAGLDAQSILDVINASSGRNSATVDKFPRAILPRTFDFGGPATIGDKDIDLYLELARTTEMPAFIGSATANLYHHLSAQIGKGQDYSNIIKVFERWGGVEVKGRAVP